MDTLSPQGPTSIVPPALGAPSPPLSPRKTLILSSPKNLHAAFRQAEHVVRVTIASIMQTMESVEDPGSLNFAVSQQTLNRVINDLDLYTKKAQQLRKHDPVWCGFLDKKAVISSTFSFCDTLMGLSATAMVIYKTYNTGNRTNALWIKMGFVLGSSVLSKFRDKTWSVVKAYEKDNTFLEYILGNEALYNARSMFTIVQQIDSINSSRDQRRESHLEQSRRPTEKDIQGVQAFEWPEESMPSDATIWNAICPPQINGEEIQRLIGDWEYATSLVKEVTQSFGRELQRVGGGQVIDVRTSLTFLQSQLTEMQKIQSRAQELQRKLKAYEKSSCCTRAWCRFIFQWCMEFLSIGGIAAELIKKGKPDNYSSLGQYLVLIVFCLAQFVS